MSPGATPTTPEEVADRLHSAAIHLLRLVRREDAASGLTAARLSALSVLVFGGARTVGELAAAEQVRPPTMSKLVAEMGKEGFVARRPSTADSRAVIVEATAKGKRALHAARRRRVATRVTTLSAADRATLSRAAAVMERLATDASAVTIA